MALRKTGHLPDPPQVVAQRLGLHHHPAFGAMRAGTLPLATNNRMTLPPSKGGPGILDQHDTSSCEGHAHASGATLRLALMGTPLPEVISPVGWYLGALMGDRQPNADGSLPRLYDTGTMPSSILKAGYAWGTCRASVWGQYPASSSTMYEDPSNENSPLIEPKPEQLFGERACRLGGAYFVQTAGTQRVLDIMRVLASGRPTSVALQASGPEFQGYKGGILQALSGDVDHANLLLDYTWTGTQDTLDAFVAAVGTDDAKATALMGQYLYFWDDNSWGEGWGVPGDVPGITGGLAQLGPPVIVGLEDPCVLDLARAT